MNSCGKNNKGLLHEKEKCQPYIKIRKTKVRDFKQDESKKLVKKIHSHFRESKTEINTGKQKQRRIEIVNQ